MSREGYPAPGPLGDNRSPRGRRQGELPTVDRSPSRGYPPRGLRQPPSPDQGYPPHHNPRTMGSPYYDHEAPPSPEERRGHRSRSATRPSHPLSVRYQSLDRERDRDREFLPIREPRERSLERGALRDRSLERGLFLEEELYGARSARQSPSLRDSGGVFIGELQHQNTDLQRELGNLKKELELTNQKLGSSMHSIKTFWSPELKKERALRKEESAKYSLINDQLKLLNNENQKQAMLVRQLEEELRLRMRAPSLEMQQQLEVLFSENEHLTREIAILRDTIKELELRIETQKQTLQARDESIKKLLEMLQNKGMGANPVLEEIANLQAKSLNTRLLEFESRALHLSLKNQKEAAAFELPVLNRRLDEFRVEIQRRDQEILGMAAKMKALDEQHQDYQRHIAVLKESLCAKEEHYNMLQADVEELRTRLEEKNRLIEKKTQTAMQATQERNRIGNELTEIKDHMDIKDRKINVLQRKLDLLEANKKLQSVGQQNAKAGDDTAVARRQLQEEFKKLEDQKKHTDEQRRNLEAKRKEIEEKERSLIEMDKQLKKRKEQMDQLEASLKKAGGSAAAAGELNKKFSESQKEADALKTQLLAAKEEAQRSAAEMERLLQLVQMSQEEQNAKEKQIMEMQATLKNLQGKLRSQQQANAQMEEQRKKEENGVNTTEAPCTTCSQRFLQISQELESKNRSIVELDKEMNDAYKILKSITSDVPKENGLNKIHDDSITTNDSKVIMEKEMESILCKLEKFLKISNDLVELQDIRNESDTKSAKIIEQEYELEILARKLTDKEEMVAKQERFITEDLNVDVEKKKKKISELTDELSIKNSKIIEQQNCLQLLEAALREHSNIAELEQLLTVVKSKNDRVNELEQLLNMSNVEYDTNQLKDDRILELEEALKESVLIAAEREKIFYHEEQERVKIIEKMHKLEQRVFSLQSASAMRCNTCRPLLRRVRQLETSIADFAGTRRQQLMELSRMKQEALEAAISEKDAHLALLEMSDSRTKKQEEDCQRLRGDRSRLMDILKKESEKLMLLLEEMNASEMVPREVDTDILNDLEVSNYFSISDNTVTNLDDIQDVHGTVL